MKDLLEPDDHPPSVNVWWARPDESSSEERKREYASIGDCVDTVIQGLEENKKQNSKDSNKINMKNWKTN